VHRPQGETAFLSSAKAPQVAGWHWIIWHGRISWDRSNRSTICWLFLAVLFDRIADLPMWARKSDCLLADGAESA